MLRQAITADEIKACMALRETVFCGEQGVTLDEEFDGLDDAAVHILGGSVDRPTCAARVRFLGGTAKIERVCVASEHRGHGSGHTLLAFVHTTMPRPSQIKTFKLEAQTQALKFYEKLGYVAQGAEFLDARIPHYVMTRPA